MGHIGIGFCFSRAIFTGYVIMVQNGITTRLLQQMAVALPKPTLLCWTERFPAVNRSGPCQDFLASCDCRATPEQSLFPWSSWTLESSFLTLPFDSLSVVWETILQIMVFPSCFLAVKLHSEAGLKRKQVWACIISFYKVFSGTVYITGFGYVRKLWKKIKALISLFQMCYNTVFRGG